MKPYYSDESVTLVHGDFRDHLAGLTADLIVADPPYGETSLEWDTWPPGWPSMLASVAPAMWAFGSLRMLLTQMPEFALWKLSHDVVWEKHNGSGFQNDRFRRVHELATHWYRGAWADRHHDVPVADEGPHTVRRKRQPTHTGSFATEVFTSHDGGPRLRTSVIYAPSMHGKAINPTEKPVSVLELLIHYGCPSGGLVVDPFAGSASTLVAARNLGRRAIGFEMRESQCEAAALRLAQQPLNFGEVS